MRIYWAALCIAWQSLCLTAFAQDLVPGALPISASTAVIALHGKWGKPPGPLAASFEAAGARVVSPVMTWSRDRLYDLDYAIALQEVHSLVIKLRAEGAATVVLAGHSLGANAAIAYAARYGDVDAMMIFAPGHVPEVQYRAGQTHASLRAARERRDIGQGERRDFEFTDFNSGDRKRQIVSSAVVYLSFYEPQGLANMSESAAQVRASIPVFYAGTTQDPIHRWGQGPRYIYDRLPMHRKSVYLESAASHIDVPQAVAAPALAFLAALDKP
jgi:pimeloyl-ACP methyl ester carboxylesterase